MNEDLKKEIITLIKDNLEIDLNDEPGCYGEGEHKSIELKLCGEVISSIDIK